MKLEKIVEIVRIKQVIQEVEGHERYVIRSPHDAAKLAADYIGDEDREVFLVMALNTKNQVIAVHRAHIGSINASIVSPREVFKVCILNNATNVIVSHNHPSGDSFRSPEDLQVTKRLVECGKYLGIEVLDHVIVTDSDEFYSMKESGDM